MNGDVSQDTITSAEKANVKILIGTKVTGTSTNLTLLTEKEL